MQELLSFQNNLLSQVNDDWSRYLYPILKGKERLLGLKGLRGVGKTTMLLQYLAYDWKDMETGMYVSADHPYFYTNTLFDFAQSWYANGGKLLLIDEVHKYPNWSRELKLIYDGHPNMQVYFTSSSALDLYRGESDLSRRLISRELHGMSFREFLELRHGLKTDPVELNKLLDKRPDLQSFFTGDQKPLRLFKQYLREGYFPFATDDMANTVSERIYQVVNTVLESDLVTIMSFNAANVSSLKKLLGVIAQSAPFQPNISQIASKLQLGRSTLVQYLKNLHDARLLNLVVRHGKGSSLLQKPDKVYFENNSFSYAYQADPNIGTIRETFFLNQLRNAGHDVNLASHGDFLVDDRWTFEIGGKSKGSAQVRHHTDSFLALDDIEYGMGRTIPLWHFGFLY